MFPVDLAKGVSSDEWIVESCSEFDFSRSSMGDSVWTVVILSILAAPGNAVVGMGGVNDGDGVMLSSLVITLVLLIASALKG